MSLTVGIVGAGDMGSAVGGALRSHGCRVITDLTGRSAETLLLAREHGLQDVGSLAAIAAQADLMLSILPPAAAQDFAERFVRETPGRRSGFVYADCNAIAPARVREIGQTVTRAGMRFIDVGIVGAPPGRTGQPTRFYASGPELEPLLELDGMGIVIKPMGADIGRASALKMLYAGENKGVQILQMSLLMAAHRLGVLEELREEFLSSKPAAWDAMRRALPGLAAVAGRWEGEMHEIAATLDAVGIAPDFYRAAAWTLAELLQTPLAQETRRTTDRARSIEATVETIERALAARGR